MEKILERSNAVDSERGERLRFLFRPREKVAYRRIRWWLRKEVTAAKATRKGFGFEEEKEKVVPFWFSFAHSIELHQKI